MPPFMFLSWRKEKYTYHDSINRTSKVRTKWYFRWGCSPTIHTHLLTCLDPLTRDCGRDNLKSLASSTVLCGKPLKQPDMLSNKLQIYHNCGINMQWSHHKTRLLMSKPPLTHMQHLQLKISGFHSHTEEIMCLTCRQYEIWPSSRRDMTNHHSNLQYHPQKPHTACRIAEFSQNKHANAKSNGIETAQTRILWYDEYKTTTL